MSLVGTTREQILERYAAYLDACNRHALDEVTGFLAPTVEVNGEPRTRQEYAEDLRALFAAFPDYRWELVRAVVEGAWLAVHLRDRGTRLGGFLGAPGDGSVVETDEFAMYCLDAQGRIAQVEVTADNARLTRIST